MRHFNNRSMGVCASLTYDDVSFDAWNWNINLIRNYNALIIYMMAINRVKASMTPNLVFIYTSDKSDLYCSRTIPKSCKFAEKSRRNNETRLYRVSQIASILWMHHHISHNWTRHTSSAAINLQCISMLNSF